MSVPNSFTSGTTISSSSVNANFTDIASEITGSLPRDGQAAMTGQLKAANGSAAAPAISFSSDTNTGLYRKAADTIGLVANGAEVVEFSTTGVSITGTLTFSGFGNGTVGAPAITFASDTDTGIYRIGADNLGIAANGAKVVDVGTAGVGVTGTLTSSSTLTVTAGGATITAGGLTVTAGTVSFPSATYASQSDMETATSTTTLVTPGRQHFHPGMAKAWALVTVSAGVPSLTSSYNVTSVTDNGVGDFSVNFTTALSSANYAAVVTPYTTTPTAGSVFGACVVGRATDTVRVVTYTTQSSTNTGAAAADGYSFSIMVFGDI